MGEIADMMLDGVLCEGCGAYLGEGHGFPGLCSGCANERKAVGRTIVDTGLGYFQDATPVNKPPSTRKVVCPECGKRVKKTGLRDHRRVVHPEQENHNDQ